MNMFSPRANDGYYALGLATARIVRTAVLDTRGVLAGGGGKELDNAEKRAGDAMGEHVKSVDESQEERGPINLPEAADAEETE